MKKILIIGCLDETLDTLSHLYHLGVKVSALVTLNKEEAIKVGISNWVDLQPFAENHGLPIHYVNEYSMKADFDINLIKTLMPEVVFVIGWQRLIPESIISLVPSGCIGFHGSANFLPWGRGRSPINWSIIEGRDRFILHMFFLTQGVDDGDIIGFEIYDIQKEDTCRSVYYKTAMAQARLIDRFLPNILKGNTPRYPQVGAEFCYPKRTPEDGKIDWNLPAENICRLTRAVTHPYPGAFTLISGQQVYIWRAQYFGDNLLISDAKPGEVLFISSNVFAEIIVRCGRGAILINEYDSPVPIRVGDIFEV